MQRHVTSIKYNPSDPAEEKSTKFIVEDGPDTAEITSPEHKQRVVEPHTSINYIKSPLAQQQPSPDTSKRKPHVLLTPSSNESTSAVPQPYQATDGGNDVARLRLQEANTRFHDAAQKLAHLLLTPTSPLRSLGHQVRRSRARKSVAQPTQVHEDTRVIGHHGSPRKLLWPTRDPKRNGEPEQSRQILGREGLHSSIIRKPRRSFVVHRSPIQEEWTAVRRPANYSGLERRPRGGARLNVPTAAALSLRHGKRLQGTTITDDLDLKTVSGKDEPSSPPTPVADDGVNQDQSHKQLAEPSPTKSPKADVAAFESEEQVVTELLDGGDDKACSSHRNLRFYAARILPSWHVWTYRACFGIIVLLVNISLLLAYFHTNRHLYLLAILAFMKSKDSLSTLADIMGVVFSAINRSVNPPKPVESRWIVSLVCAYAETDEQIAKTVRSLTQQDLGPHKQMICIILDGKTPDVLSHFSKVYHKLRRSYFTWKGSTGELVIYSGIIDATPTILVQKLHNAGKKDSLILGHDMFNYPRADMPQDTMRLRNEIYTRVVPTLTGERLSTFDFVFCTDADSTIHLHSLRQLADSLARNDAAIAACGVLVAELAVPEVEWSVWHLYQQFQYTFGQYVRRQAEGLWGRVTCLPGCITMLTVRPEMGAAISMYAKPVTNYNILEHQVQYLGTDRRLTYCILAQSSTLKSLFVPEALCETVVPDSLEHYLSQRRRWASNAYFNDYYYAFGRNQFLVTRLFALIDIVRQTLVFYRVINTALFLMSLVQRFYIVKIIPTLILTKAPATWYIILILAREKVLRRRVHKLFLGMCINQVISPCLSVIVFANVLLNMGSQVWGTTGASSADPRHPPTPYVAIPPEYAWSPTKLAGLVRTAITGERSQQRSKSDPMSDQTPQQQAHCDRVRSMSVPCTPGSTSAMTTFVSGSEIRHRTPGRSIAQH